MSNIIRTYYDYVLAQMAADSYLDNLLEPDFDFKDEDKLAVRLRDGANHYSIIGQLRKEGPLSATQMTPVMINDFISTWEVIDHLPNTSSGFSATVLKNKLTGEYTLSFRSTESKDAGNGGDVERDSSAGANGQITDLGFAWGQLRDMENYYQDLISAALNAGSVEDAQALANYLADPAKRITVTGYSLGSHMAQLFTMMYDDDIEHTYTFNGAGFGKIDGVSTVEGYGSAVLERIQLLDAIIKGQLGPATLLDEVTYNEFAEILSKNVVDIFLISKSFLLNIIIDEHNNGDFSSNIFDDPLFKFAINALPDDTTGAQTVAILELLPGSSEVTRDQITPFEKITNLFGHAIPTENRLFGEVVSGSGQIFGDFSPVFIEDQPVFDVDFFSNVSKILLGPNNRDALLRSFGPTHSITLIADSLAVIDLFKTIDPRLTLQDINVIFSVINNARVNNIPGFRQSEGNTLEIALDSLGEIFFADQWVTTVSDNRPGSFADLDLRSNFYINVDKLRKEIFENEANSQLKTDYQNLGLELKNLQGLQQPELVNNAKDSLSYRYALKELNSFVIKAISSVAESQLYNQHNLDQSLEIFHPATGLGMTAKYIEDRAAFLTAKISMGLTNTLFHEVDATQSDIRKFIQLAPGGTVVERADEIGKGLLDFSTNKNIIFGSDASDPKDSFKTSAHIDHVYGGGGIDKIFGQAGGDYIEGNADDDVLVGGQDADELQGGHGNDTLWHADDLTTSEDNARDILEGGQGHDTYHVGLGDEISDSDNDGDVFYQNTLLRGGAVVSGATDTYKDGSINYQWSGTAGDTLSISVKSGEAPILIHVFNNGDLGIQLLTSTPDKLLASSQDDIFGSDSVGNTYSITEGTFSEFPNESTKFFVEPLRHIQGLGGADTIQINADIPNQVIFGDSAFQDPDSDGDDFIIVDHDSVFNDVIHTDPLHGSFIWGEGGDDFISGSNRDDYLSGDTGHDFIKGNDNDDQIFGGSGNDWLEGGLHADQLSGNNNNDWLFGGAGSDQLIGGQGDDRLWGDTGGATYYRNASGSFWEGATETFNPVGLNLNSGQGQATIVEDVQRFLGGSDVLEGGAGDDDLYGGVGDDFLYGDEDHDILQGEGGDDQLFGGSGRDILWGDKDPAAYDADHAPLTAQGHIFRKHSDAKDVAGNDQLDGGRDNDILMGGGGDDTYLFARGYGTDVIDDESGFDRVKLAAGIGIEDLLFEKTQTNLVIKLTNDGADTGDQLILTDWFAGRLIELVELNSGAALDVEDILDRVQGNGIPQIENLPVNPVANAALNITLGTDIADTGLAGSGDDTIYGLGGNDILAGGGGNDRVFGGTGDDELQGNDGNDQLIGEAGNDILFGQAGDDQLFGGAGADELQGGEGNDTLQGDAGADNLTGGLGNDAYVFNRGDGDDFIRDDGGTADKIIFGKGIAADQLSFDVSGNNLIINILNQGQLSSDKLTIIDWFNADNQIESVRFADDTVLDATAIQALLPDDLLLANGQTALGGSGASTYRFIPDANLVEGFQISITDAGGYDKLQLERAVLNVPNVGNFFATPSIDDSVREGTDIILNVSVDSQIGNIPSASGQIRIVDFYTPAGFIEIIQLGNTLVNSPNSAPIVSGAIPDQIIEQGLAYNFQAPLDTFTDNAFDTLSFSARLADDSELPTWLSFDSATARFTGTPGVADSAIINIVVTATDSKGLTASTGFELNVGNVNVAPTVATTIADQTSLEGTVFTYTLPVASFTDKNLNESLTLNVSSLGGGLLPAWLSFDALSNTLSGTPATADAGTVVLQASATDSGGLSTTDVFVLDVGYLNDAPVLNSAPLTQTAIEQQSFSFALAADTFTDSDSIHGDILTYTASQLNGSVLPGWLLFNPDTLEFSGRPVGLFEDTTIDLRVTATDSDGLSAQADFTLNVQDSPQAVDWLVPHDALPVVNNNFSQSNSVTAALADGGYVVIWQSQLQAGEYGAATADIFGQRFDANGNALGTEFQVNSTTADQQSAPTVAGLQGGGFVVSWDSLTPGFNSIGTDVFAQRFDGQGLPEGSEFRVSPVFSGDQNQSAITALGDGGFVVSWYSRFSEQHINNGEYGGGEAGIFGQRYSSNGNVVSAAFRIGNTSGTGLSQPAVAGLIDGGFVATWQTSVFADSIRGQRYAANGTPLGAEFLVNSTVTNSQHEPSVTGLADGGFVITWRSDGQDGDQGGIYGQRYNASGILLGTEFNINTHTTGLQSNPDVTATPDGGFVVTWHSDMSSPAGGFGGVYSQQFDINGNRIGEEQAIHVSPTFIINSLPSVLALSDGTLVYSWTRSDAGGTGVQSRLFEPVANTGPVAVQEVATVNTSVYRQVNLQLSEQVFFDPDLTYGDSLTYDATLASGAPLPAWLAFDSASGSFSGLPLPGDIGSLSVKLTAIDTAGETAEHAFDINVNPAPAIAVTPDFSTFTVNTTEPRFDFSPVATTLSDNTQVVIWVGDGGIYGQRYADDGVAIGAEFRVDGATGFTFEPSVAALTGGGFAVTWLTGDKLIGRQYAASGTATGSEFLIKDTATGFFAGADIAGLKGGGFVVSWLAQDAVAGTLELLAQQYSADAIPQAQASEIQVTQGAFEPTAVAVTGLSDGGFVMVWSAPHGTDGGNIYTQRYDSQAQAVGNVAQVNEISIDRQFQPAVSSLADGGYVVTWTSDLNNGDEDIYGRRFDANGNPLGRDWRINNFTDQPQKVSSVSASAGGGFVVSWHSDVGFNSSEYGAVHAQNFDQAGNPTGDVFQVNAVQTQKVSSPSIAPTTDGGFNVYWETLDSSGFSDSILGRHYSVGGADLNLLPTVTLPVIDQIISEDVLYTFSLNSGVFTDADGDALTIRANLAGGDGLPAWLSFDSQLLQLNGTPFNEDVGDYAITFTATDPSGESVADTFNLTVLNINDAPDAVADSAGLRLDAGVQSISLDVLANDLDVDASDTPTSFSLDTVTLQGNKGSVSIVDNRLVFDAGLDFAGLTGEQIETITVDYTMSDSSGESASSTASIVVHNGDAVIGTKGNDVMQVFDRGSYIGIDGDDIYNISNGASATIRGGRGADRYNFSSRSGRTSIFDSSSGLGGRSTVSPNVASFTGYTRRQMNLRFGSLLLTFEDSDLEIHLENFDPNDVLNGPRTIDTFIFNGIEYSYEEIVSQGFDVDGTDVDDVITGTNIVDRLNGLTGNDSLDGGEGDDVLTGGVGNDELIGGTGDDSYIFNPGDGHDTISDVNGIDRIVFGAGLSSAAAVSVQEGNDLLLSLNTNDSITIKDWYLDSANQIENFIFTEDNVRVVDEVVIETVDANHAPQILGFGIGDQVSDEDAPFSFVVPEQAFTDPDLNDSLSFSASISDGGVLPAWLKFDTITKTFSGTPGNDDVGSFAVKVTATDAGLLSVSDEFNLIVNNSNDAPQILVPGLADQVVFEAADFSFALPLDSFTDVDTDDSLTYSAVLEDGSALPPWLLFDASTNTFSGTPPTGAGSLSINVTATDTSGETATDSFVITALPSGLNPIQGTNEGDTLYGTADADRINGLAGNDYLHGGAGNDELNGDSGNDTLIGAAGDDQLNAGEGDDFLDGNEGNDLLLAGVGNDRLEGGSGDDILQGEEGNDVLYGEDGVDQLTGAAGDDYLHGGAGNDQLDGGLGNDTLYGGEGDDTLLASDGDDFLDGNEGNDVLLAGIGNDRLEGGSGDDILQGEEGNDVLYGEDGVDQLTGAAGDDYLHGGAGNDQLDGGLGNDTLYGGEGDDTLLASDGDDFLDGNEGNDLLLAGVGNDRLEGGSGDDILQGEEGNDVLYGEDGVDQLTGAAGDDYLHGGAGNDQLDGGLGNDTLYGGEGDDTLLASDGDDFLDGNEGNDVLLAGIGNDRLEGGSGDDILQGEEGNDVLYGEDGVDQLTGAAGDDYLHGGAGNDQLDGGLGNDTLYGGEGDDTLLASDGDDFLDGNEGNDLLLAGVGNDRLEGGSGDDILQGEEGNDVLYGEDGVDQLTGAAGDDYLHGGAGNDQLDGGLGNDTLYGGEGDDTLLASDGDDFLDGNEGNDVLLAGIGNDRLEGGSGDDILQGEEGNDVLYGEDGVDQLMGASGDDYLHGGAGNDLLDGDIGNDTLIGDAGDDQLAGGSGIDFLQGGTGNDVYRYNRNDAADTILDVGGFSDRLNIGGGVNHDNLWFWQQGQDLRLGIVGTQDWLTIDNWYVDAAYKVEEIIALDDGYTLIEGQVQQLVDAMAVFDVQAQGHLNLTQASIEAVQPVIASAWQSS